MIRHACAALWLFTCLLGACGEDTSSSGEPGPSPSADAVGSDALLEDGGTPAAGCADGSVGLRFMVDDTANKTYGPGELIWTGSFAWDEASNTLAYATSWLPEEGPYPPLFDDGPRSAGGHEPEGSVAGDHVWGIAVCYVAEQTRTLSYGLLNDELRWIWEGPNGTIEVAEEAEGTLDVPGMAIAAHGDRDFRLMLQLDELHSDYQGSITTVEYGIFVKGTMNSWTPVQLLDDGQGGDAVAGDGVLTYEHSRFLGPHDGLLRPGQEAQFVFVFALGESAPDSGLEYKVDGDAALEGIDASGQCEGGWEPLEVVQSLDSKGVVLNAAIQVCQDGSAPMEACEEDADCAPDEHCEDGECLPDSPPEASPEIWLLVPDLGDVLGGDTVSVQGSGFQLGAEVSFGGEAAKVVSLNSGEILVETPAHDAGDVDVVVTNPDESLATYPGGFTYAEDAGSNAVKITEVTPATLSPMGGTTVALQGVGLDAACGVTLAGEALAETGYQGGAITFTAPRHLPGDVSLALDCEAGATELDVTYAHAFDGAFDDWPAQTQLSTNEVVSNWGEQNWLQGLYAGTDGATLYVGVAGHSLGDSGMNAIVAYVDADYGSGTGLTVTSEITDEQGAPDSALGGILTFSDAAFGAELGFASLDLSDYWPGEGDPAAANAGWRAFENPGDLAWLLDGPVIGDSAGLEASIPLADVFEVATGEDRTIAIAVRLVSATGDYVSNQALPGLTGSEAEATSDTVSTLTLTY